MDEIPHAPFWMVFGLGQREPTHRHLTKAEAETESRRLARAHPGIAFVVLEAVSATIKDDLKTVTFRRPPDRDSDDIPF